MGVSPLTEAQASGTVSEMTEKVKATHNILATDTKDPADEVQDFLHRNGHRSPKLRAREPEQKEP